MFTTNTRLNRHLYGMLASLFVFFSVSCSDKDNGDAAGAPYDPNQPVTITDFNPKTGGMGQKVILYGNNFGNDSTKVRVTIGDKRAPLIGVKNDCLYFFMPSKPLTGKVTVAVGDSAQHTVQEAVASSTFDYKIMAGVGTLLGYKNQNDDQGEKSGTFEEVAGQDRFAGIHDNGVLTFDPLYKNRLYMIIDGGDASRPGIQCIDFNTKKVTTVLPHSLFDNKRLRGIDFAMKGKYMLVAVDDDAAGNKSTVLYIVTRNADGTFTSESDIQPLAAYKQCNGVSVHPIHDNEVYFNSYEQGQIFKIDLNDYFDAINKGEKWEVNQIDNPKIQHLFDIDEKETEAKMVMHPSGKYAYILIINRGYIQRMNYDETTHKFTAPYNVAGVRGQYGWNDAVGTNARFNGPYQGVFVKNPSYVAEGKEDVYDFYMAEMENHDVRVMTPETVVTTYAGRGTRSKAKDNNDWGNENGSLRGEARFNRPSGIAYDESNGSLYVIDRENRVVRQIYER